MVRKLVPCPDVKSAKEPSPSTRDPKRGGRDKSRLQRRHQKRPLEVELIDTKKLEPYVANARTHSDEQVSQIAASIERFGFNNPVLINRKGILIAGHARLLAATTLGLERVPAIRLRHLTKTQARAYRIADNRLPLNAAWNEDLLRLELGELQSEAFDLTLLGFDPAELTNFLAPLDGGLTDPDDAPEHPVKPVSALGDCWVLGRHRTQCGDSTAAADVERLLAGVRPHLMVTDQPFGVEYDPSWRVKAGINKNKGRLGKVVNDDQADWRKAWELFPSSVAYVWHAGRHASTVQSALEAAGFKIRSQIIWAKDRFALSRGHYHWQHEPCWYAVRGSASWRGDRKQSTLWQISAREGCGLGHSTQKPVECMKRPIENNSSTKAVIYEPFSGSGTTTIAAEMTGRVCYAMEISPAYVDVAVTRWQNFTGGTAILAGDGRSFSVISAERGTALAGR
jgi:DNA modification methylase